MNASRTRTTMTARTIGKRKRAPASPKYKPVSKASPSRTFIPGDTAGIESGPVPDETKAGFKTNQADSNTRKANESDKKLASKKLNAWSAYTAASPFPDFKRPTVDDCEVANRKLKQLHQEAVDTEFADENTPETIPHVLDAMVVAILSQATGWSNAKRAMNSMKSTYGSIFAYDKIYQNGNGREQLQEVLKPGGLHVRKSMIIMTILGQVQEKKGGNGEWNLDHMFDLSDQEAMQELLGYKYIGTKSASVVMGWCLKRNPFTVDTHVYRLAGIWGWRPEKASREQTQSHLEVMIPPRLKFDLHFLMIAHGRACPACRGGGKKDAQCTLVTV